MKRATWTIIAVIIAPIALIAFEALRPRIIVDSEGPERVICASHLRQIGTGLQLYALSNGNRYPDSFKTVLRTEDLTPEMFVCPTDDAEAAASVEAFRDTSSDCSYLYFADELKNDGAADVILAMERVDNHDHNGINVLLGDGHVDFIQIASRNKPVPAWWSDIEGQIARHARPIRLPTSRPTR